MALEQYGKFVMLFLALPPVVLAITVHEYAHGRVALWCGDHTAKMMGRLTINPLKHIDPVGTVAVPLFLYFVSQFATGTPIFGWAKPVPVDISRLRNPLRDQFWVSLAGPASNLLMALAWALLVNVLAAASEEPPLVLSAIATMAVFGVAANIGLMVINMVPILPLDGGRVLLSLLPRSYAYQFQRTEPYGFFILVALLMTHVLDSVISVPLRFFLNLLLP